MFPTLHKKVDDFDIKVIILNSKGTFDCQSFSKSSTWVSLWPLCSRSGKNCISAVMSKASKNLRQIKKYNMERRKLCSLIEVLLPSLVDLAGRSENPTAEESPSLRIPVGIKFGVKDLISG